jgi:hypothetical protein
MASQEQIAEQHQRNKRLIEETTRFQEKLDRTIRRSQRDWELLEADLRRAGLLRD